MKTKQTVQEIKAERVQEEIARMVEEPLQISLKAERVQGPELALGAGVQMFSAFELTMNQKRPVTIELPTLPVIITLHGTAAGAGVASAQAPDLGEAGEEG